MQAAAAAAVTRGHAAHARGGAASAQTQSQLCQLLCKALRGGLYGALPALVAIGRRVKFTFLGACYSSVLQPLEREGPLQLYSVPWDCLHW